MGFFSNFFGKSPSTPDQVLAALIAAASAQNEARIQKLCAAHRDLILTSFPAWSKIPPELQKDDAQAQLQIKALIAIAQTFQQKFNDPSLLNRLLGTPADNPLLKWQEDLTLAQTQMQDLEFSQAKETLTNLLIDSRQLTGPAKDELLPVTHGALASCLFQLSRIDDAQHQFKTAQSLCQQQNDTEGFLTYSESLFELFRYAGDSKAASDAADELSKHLNRGNQIHRAERFKTRAQIIRNGEPLCRIILSVNEKQLELSQVGKIHGNVRFLFERNRLTLQLAQHQNQLGGQLGSQMKSEEALTHFAQAAKIDPFDPVCHYDAGLTHTILGNFNQAITEYEITQTLAPGWFNINFDLWLAEQLASGRLPHQAFMAHLLLDNKSLPPEEVIKQAKNAVDQFPDVPFLRFDLGIIFAQSGDASSALAQLEKALTLDPEPDIHTRLLMQSAALLEPGQLRTQLLTQAVELNGNLLAAAMAQVTLKQSE